ncbi:SusC/RagA family TonB-linked outer membrane protein [Pinibacter soli]|uniref:SusC/RagA family TonB-linked outer membrane protein n=1 Tax=Pinibacter soli TaxID=3044211 RepID=A0ABT6RE37_9BACT|nr:SusC/RagA family TonB-linked outer membrane protein [Pinibacter soli]MDI3320838.1 SusC/RagA family TonB-linked outer membrane protein [Pinibacter soli]
MRHKRFPGYGMHRRFLRIVAVFVMVSTQVFAKSIAQRITYSGKDVSLTQIFSVIKKQTGYVTFYSTELIKNTKPVSVSAKDVALSDFLTMVLKDQDLDFSLSDKTIMLSKRVKQNTSAPLVESNDPIPATLKGTVFCKEGPVAGAAVMLKPIGIGMATNSRGEFSLANVPQGEYTLEISSIGYKAYSKKITIGSSVPKVNVTMEPEMQVQEEIVVSTGYSSKKPGEITGAVQKISGDELRKGITTSDPTSLLKGRVTGLYISEQNAGDPTSSGGQIFMRGQSSIVGVGLDQANEYVIPTINYGPLIVLDGVIMPNQNLKELVSPNEIQEITTLKDAAATAVYGSRAAGGVLVVTTKKGKDARPRVSAELKYGINKPNQGTIKYMNGQELYNYQKDYFTADYSVNGGSLASMFPTVEDYLHYKLPTQQVVANSYDWTKFVFVTSNTMEANLSASGGNERSKYYFGGTYYNEQSTGVQNGLTRGNFRLNLDSRLTSRLSLNVSLNGIINSGKRDPNANTDFFGQLIPWANPYDSNGNVTQTLNYKFNGIPVVKGNPLFDKQYNFNKLQSQLFFGSVRLEYRITDWLSLSSTNSGNLNYNKNQTYIDVRTYNGGTIYYAPQGFLGTTTSNLSNFLTSNQLSFRKKYGKSAIRALAAMEYGETTRDFSTVNVNHVRAGYPQISMGSQVGPSYDFSIFGIPTTKAGNIEGGTDKRAQFSAFGEAGYTYNDRYTVSGSIRTDASSSFGADNRYGTFYSTGAAWIVNNENFMKNVKWVNNLKVRASYGTTGSQLGDNFLTKTLYNPTLQYSGQNAAVVAVLANPNLKWEITKTFNGGLDFTLFKNLDVTLDAYSRRSEDLLQKVALPPTYGFPTQWQNVANVQNHGVELMLNWRAVNKKDFQWSTSFNLSYNRNKIIAVANDSLVQGWNQQAYYLYPGEDINTLKAVKWAGVDPQTGKPQYEKLIFDASGKKTGVELVNSVAEVGASTDQRQNQSIGSFQPKFYGGFTNTFSYKQFSLNVLITYALKYVMNDGAARAYQGTSPMLYNQIKYKNNQVPWTTPGQTNATEPWVYYQGTGYRDYFGSSKYMHDASNASLRSVRLSYDLPSSILTKLRLSTCSFYVSGDNLYTLYSKSIVAANPEGPSVGEAQGFGQSAFGLGIPRRYMFGVQLTF